MAPESTPADWPMYGLDDGDSAPCHWPGLFTHDRLHSVQRANTERLAVGTIRYGLADCGAVCLPLSAHASRDMTLCRRCFPPADLAPASTGAGHQHG